jgi:ketosteroid isomerase-like protein
MSTDTLAVVAAFNAAWGAHDLDATLALTTDDALFESTGPAPDGVAYIGHDAIREAWRPIFDDHASRFEQEEALDASDGAVVVRWSYHWADGHVRGIDLFRIRDGKVSEKRSYVKG